MFTQKTLRTALNFAQTENPKNIQSSCWNHFKTTMNLKVTTRNYQAFQGSTQSPINISIFRTQGKACFTRNVQSKNSRRWTMSGKFFFFLPNLMNKSICFHRFRTIFSYFCVQNLGLNEFNVNLLSLIL